MKKVIVVYSSYRKGGNSELLAEEFAKGATDAGNTVERIFLRDLNINFCRGCLACQKIGKCVINDDLAKLIDVVRNADVLCFATPIYYYAISGQLKTFLDRMNPIFAIGHNFRDVYLITSANDTDPSAMDTAVSDIQGWCACFSGVSLAGVVRGNSTNNIGDIKKYPNKLIEAYNLGKNL